MIDTFAKRLDAGYNLIFSEKVKNISKGNNPNIFQRKRLMPLPNILLCSLNKQGLNTKTLEEVLMVKIKVLQELLHLVCIIQKIIFMLIF